MHFIKNIYYFFYNFFDMLSFRTKPTYECIDVGDEDVELEFLNNKSQINR